MISRTVEISDGMSLPMGDGIDTVGSLRSLFTTPAVR